MQQYVWRLGPYEKPQITHSYFFSEEIILYFTSYATEAANKDLWWQFFNWLWSFFLKIVVIGVKCYLWIKYLPIRVHSEIVLFHTIELHGIVFAM